MKYQKAKSIVHQHRVAQSDLERAQSRQRIAQEAYREVDQEPARVREQIALHQASLTKHHAFTTRELQDRQIQINKLQEEMREFIKERTTEAVTMGGHIKTYQDQLHKHSTTTEAQVLDHANGEVKRCELVVARWSQELEEAKATVDHVKAQEAVKATVPPEIQKAQAERRKLNQQIRSGKRVLRSRVDTMGNKDLTGSKPSKPLVPPT